MTSNDPNGLKLYQAPSSYYSMIARLALAENGIAYEPVFLDIHVRMSQQAPDYARLNSGMTVPTLAGPGFVLTESRDIAEYAFGLRDTGPDAETRGWLDAHYAFPVEELTFGRLLSQNALARKALPLRIEAAGRRLLALAEKNPDLATAYRDRARVFASRRLAFDPQLLGALWERRRQEAIALLEKLDAALADGRDALVPPRFGVADVVWSVFLARIEFVGLAKEIQSRPALLRYWDRIQIRRGYRSADIWTRMHFGRLLAGILGLKSFLSG